MRPITELTDSEAMLKAVREAVDAHRAGHDFRKMYDHGYEKSEKWVIVADGIEIDSKPLAATAFYHQHGEFPSYIGGGTRALRTALRAVGFELQERQGPDWSTPIGARVTKTEIAAQYGGARMGGILPSRTSKNVLLYSDPDAGSALGYNFDGWSADGQTYSYTGEGQRGPQNLQSGNAAVLHHREMGKSLRLFVTDGYVGKSKTKSRVYVGEFVLDDEHPYSVEDALDIDRQMRTVYVFHLKPAGKVLRREADFSDSPVAPSSVALVENVPLENHLVSDFSSPGAGPVTAEKREQALVERFREVLLARGHEASRWKITPPESTRAIYSDIYDETSGTLFEAKGQSTRDHIRMGLGQILDYKRHTPEEVKAFALLLPAEPHSDLLDLLRVQGVGAVWPDPSSGDFFMLTAGGSEAF